MKLGSNPPKLLKGYGRTFQGYAPNYRAAVILVCDLDNKNLKAFLIELNYILNALPSEARNTFLHCN